MERAAPPHTGAAFRTSSLDVAGEGNAVVRARSIDDNVRTQGQGVRKIKDARCIRGSGHLFDRIADAVVVLVLAERGPDNIRVNGNAFDPGIAR